MRARGRRIGAITVPMAAGLFAVPLLAGCNDDGRTLRPARPDQVASVSTTAPPDTALADVDDPEAAFDITLPTEGESAPPTTVANSSPVLTASWKDGGAIDSRHTCDGIDVSPALRWSAAPAGTVEIAISVIDDDTPAYIHWVIAALDPLSTSIAEGAASDLAIEATNSAGTVGWAGPCPPAGATHHYRFTVHFLAQQTELGHGAPAADLVAFVEGASFSTATLTAIYSAS